MLYLVETHFKLFFIIVLKNGDNRQFIKKINLKLFLLYTFFKNSFGNIIGFLGF